MTKSSHKLFSIGKLADAALRNLHMDCQCPAPDGRSFVCRMVAWDDGVLVATPPSAHGHPVRLSAGQAVVCSCRLGQEVLRFTALVSAGPSAGETGGAEQAHLRLEQLSTPRVVQRRRYYRVSLAGRQPSAVTCWLVDLSEPGLPRVCAKLDGRATDVSRGGIGVVIGDGRVLEDAEHRQVWVRFTLPQENESLIFRAAPRHAHAEPDGTCRIGLEFMEYIEPGRHQAVIDRLSRFVASETA